jgi:hypothetical protein
MIQTFTQTDLIRFLYHETSEEENRKINRALILDSELKTLYNELSSMKKDMDDAQVEPSASTVLNILSYSKTLQERPS